MYERDKAKLEVDKELTLPGYKLAVMTDDKLLLMIIKGTCNRTTKDHNTLQDTMEYNTTKHGMIQHELFSTYCQRTKFPIRLVVMLLQWLLY